MNAIFSGGRILTSFSLTFLRFEVLYHEKKFSAINYVAVGRWTLGGVRQKVHLPVDSRTLDSSLTMTLPVLIIQLQSPLAGLVGVAYIINTTTYHISHTSSGSTYLKYIR